MKNEDLKDVTAGRPEGRAVKRFESSGGFGYDDRGRVEDRRRLEQPKAVLITRVCYGTTSVTSFDTPLVPHVFCARKRTK
jgi:hypothetical protein